MHNLTIEFDGGFYRVYRHGFITGIFTSEADALAHRDKIAAQKTYHPDYRLVYPSRDGAGMPKVYVNQTA